MIIPFVGIPLSQMFLNVDRLPLIKNFRETGEINLTSKKCTQCSFDAESFFSRWGNSVVRININAEP